MCRNVSGAQRELLKYYASVTSNRWLILKIFGVLIIFVSRPPGRHVCFSHHFADAKQFLVFILVS